MAFIQDDGTNQYGLKPATSFVPDKPKSSFVPDAPSQALPATPEKKKGIFGRIGDVFKQEYVRMEDKAIASVDALAGKEQGWLETVAQVGAAAAGSGARIVSRGAIGAIKAVTPDPVEEAVKKGFKTTLDVTGTTAALGVIVPEVKVAWDTFKTENPRAARNLTAGADVIEAVGTVKLGNKVEAWLKKNVPAAAANIKLAAEARKARAISLQEGQAVDKIMGQSGAPVEGNRALLERGAADARVAGLKLDPKTGAIVPDSKAQSAIHQGVPPAETALVKSADPATKSEMKKMLDTRVAQSTDLTLETKPGGRAADTMGKVVFDEHARPLEVLNRNAGKQLEVVANGLKGKPIVVNQAFDQFTDDLARARVYPKPDGTLDFTGSDFHNLPGPQASLNNAWERLNGITDARDAHGLKRYVDSLVTYGGGDAGLKGQAKNILKSLRHNIDFALDSTYADYNAVNQVYSDTVRALDEIEDAIGSTGFNLEGPFAEMAAGVKFRGLFANTNFRAVMSQALNTSTEVLTKYGFSPKTDLYRLAKFADVMEKAFGPEATTSFTGSIITAGDVLSSGAQVASGSPVAVARGALGLVSSVGKALSGVNRDNYIKALYGLLN